MSFTEKLLAYTTRIEKQLVELGGSGKGMMEKARNTTQLVPLQTKQIMRFVCNRDCEGNQLMFMRSNL